MNILIVDDSEAVVEEMKSIITETGHTLFIAHDGAAGLAELAVREIDVVIADFHLPRIDGLTMITFYLKLRDEGIGKIMLTTEISPAMKEKGDKIGIDAWMPKPLKKEVIFKALEDIAPILDKRLHRNSA